MSAKKITKNHLTLLSLSVFLLAWNIPASAEDLTAVYQQAAQNNATYQAARMTYEAAKENIPITFSALLPTVTVGSPTTAFARNFNTHQTITSFGLTATQPVFNYSDWKTYTQAQFQLKQDALTYSQALQTLTNTVATDYFQVLEDQEQLRFSVANVRSNQENLDQAEQQYKVGLKAITDVQSAKATYESAVATQINDENQVQDALQTLSALTGQPEKQLSLLKSDFPKIKPSPADPSVWVRTAMKHNLNVLLAQEQVEIDKAGVQVQEAAFYPTANVQGTYAYVNTTGASSANTTTASVNASWTVFSGFSTVHSVKQSEFTQSSDQDTYLQQQRDTASQTQSDYLTVLSDIAQIEAYKQAVISGEASVKAAKAQYQVGTTTIYDLLQEQTNLFQAEQQYATSLYQYINDSLKLKTDAGLLSSQDIMAINNWLEIPTVPAAGSSSTPSTPASSDGQY